MKKKIFILFLLLASFGLFSKAQLNQYLVKFTNKATQTYSLQHPEAYLSSRAISNRISYGIAIDSSDLPIPLNYIDSVKLAGAVTLVSTSKWLNQIAIKTTDATALAKINGFPFVETVSGIAARPQNQLRKNKLLNEVEYPISHTNTPPQTELANVYNYGLSNGQVVLHQGNFLHNLGFSGQGMQMAILDAGFPNYISLPTFDSARLNQQFLGTWDFVNNTPNVNGFHHHGTQCLSTIAANLPGSFVGTGPKTSFYLFRTEDAPTEYPIEEQNIAAALEKADSLGVNMASISLGYYEFDDATLNHTYADMDGNTTLAARAADMAAKKGMLLVVAAGNEGNNPWHYLITPADADSVLAVGAVNTAGAVGSFSSYGPSSDGQIKPGVAAVGVSAVVANYITGQPAYGSGTSFACPNMAGLTSCLWQAFPEENNMGIISALQESASKYNNPDNRVGYGIPDMKKAFVLLLKRFYSQQIKLDGCKASISFSVKSSAAMSFTIERKLPSDADFVAINTLNDADSFAKKNFHYSDELDLFTSPINIAYRVKMTIDTDTSFYFPAVTIAHLNPCHSYTFIGNGAWDVPSNWAAGIIPPIHLPAGSSIFIDPIASGACLLNVNQTIEAGAHIEVKAGKKLVIPGNLNIQ